MFDQKTIKKMHFSANLALVDGSLVRMRFWLLVLVEVDKSNHDVKICVEIAENCCWQYFILYKII
jgi:hypothetical protein